MTRATDIDRRLELLCDRALAGLDPDESAELDRLLAADPDLDGDALDRTAAAVTLSQLSMEPMPASLLARLEADAAAHFAKSPAAPANGAAAPAASVIPLAPRRASSAVGPSSTLVGGAEPRLAAPPPARWRALPWLLAAACFAIAVASWVLRPAPEVVTVREVVTVQVPPPAPPAPREAREKLLAEAKDAVRIDWSATKDPAAAGAGGDVVWSPSRQQGYMRFRGLAPLDRQAAQFQLWIFDRSQDDKTPIDGGVFDVDPSTGDVIVPIQPKLRVDRPYLFAVTIEKPGGVVVSKREHIVLTAAVSG